MSTSIQKKIAFFPPAAETILLLEQPREFVGTQTGREAPTRSGRDRCLRWPVAIRKTAGELPRPERWINSPTPGPDLVPYSQGLPRNSLPGRPGSPKPVFPWKAEGKGVRPPNVAIATVETATLGPPHKNLSCAQQNPYQISWPMRGFLSSICKPA